MIVYLTLLAGLMLSATAGYYSVIGLLAIFPGAILPIVIMGGTLEFAKLVSVSWLYRNWERTPVMMKGYFLFAIFILMFITSLGTFGFLSKVHLSTSQNVDTVQFQVDRIQKQIDLQQILAENAQKSINTMDNLVNSTTDPDKANIIRNRQKNERAKLTAAVDDAFAKISKYTEEQTPYKTDLRKIESEIGPLKYIAEAIYGNTASNHFDSAVRFVIILIVLVFDPLAILLLIAANMSSLTKKKVAKPKKIRYNNSIADDSVYKFKTTEDFGIKATDKID